MGLLSNLLSSRTDEDAQLDSYLYQQSKGVLNADDARRMRDMVIRLGLSDADLKRRLDGILKRKAEAAEQREADNPPFTDEGVVLAEPEPAFLSHELLARYIDNGRLPHPAAVRYHKHPSMAEDEFTHLIGVLRDMHDGKRRLDRIAYCRQRGEQFGGGASRSIGCFLPDDVPLGFHATADEWSYVRGPGQTHKQFDAALRALNEAVEEQRKRDSLGHSTRHPAFV